MSFLTLSLKECQMLSGDIHLLGKPPAVFLSLTNFSFWEIKDELGGFSKEVLTSPSTRRCPLKWPFQESVSEGPWLGRYGAAGVAGLLVRMECVWLRELDKEQSDFQRWAAHGTLADQLDWNGPHLWKPPEREWKGLLTSTSDRRRGTKEDLSPGTKPRVQGCTRESGQWEQRAWAICNQGV